MCDNNGNPIIVTLHNLLLAPYLCDRLFQSLVFLPLLHAILSFSLKCTCFLRFSFYFGDFRLFAIMLSSFPHLQHFQGIRFVRLLFKSSAAHDFSFSYLILLKHFNAEWLTPPHELHFI